MSWCEQLNINFDEKYINKKIDVIYAEIIQSLIFQKKFEDYEFSNNILTQLELKSIDITSNIFNNIKNILDNKNNNCISNYLISKESDLFDAKKINFYYILLYFILKNSVFVYEINFLLKTRIFFVKLINAKSDIFSSYDARNMNANLKKRLDYIFEILLDSNYYIQKYISLKLNECDSDIIEPEVIDEEESDKAISNENSIDEESIKEENNNEDGKKENNSNGKNNNEEKSIEESSDEDNIIRPINDSSYRDSNEVSKNPNSDNQYIEKSNEKDNKNNKEKSILNNGIVTVSLDDNNSQIKINSSSLLSQNSPREKIKKSKFIPSKKSSNRRKAISSFHTRNSNPNLNNKNNNNIIPYQIFEFQSIIGNHKKKEDNKNKNMNKRFTADFITQINEGFISGGFNNIFIYYNKNSEKEMEIKDTLI